MPWNHFQIKDWIFKALIKKKNLFVLLRSKGRRQRVVTLNPSLRLLTLVMQGLNGGGAFKYVSMFIPILELQLVAMDSEDFLGGFKYFLFSPQKLGK